MQYPPMSLAATSQLRKDPGLYREFLAEREEILRHKWLESEKVDKDIGFERALLDWLSKHRSSWIRGRDTSTARFSQRGDV